jgi:hypothetical protein
MPATPITSLTMMDGSPAQHLTFTMYDQYDNPMPGISFTVTQSDPTIDTFVPDASGTGGMDGAIGVGTDHLTISASGITLDFPVTGTPGAPVPTTIRVTSP